MIFEGTKFVEASRFISGTLTGNSFAVNLQFIQTNNIITLGFTLANDLPAYESGETEPKIVFIMPEVMAKSSQANQLQISNLDGSIKSNVMGTQGYETSFQYYDGATMVADCSD